MSSVRRRPDGVWRARYRDVAGKEHARHFERKVDAQRWLDEVSAAVVTGTYVDPKTARVSVAEWCTTWRNGYAGNRASTVRQAEVHLARIVAEFGPMRLADVRPSHVRSWLARLQAEGLSASYVYALHGRLAQVFSDAVHDGIVPRSPCSRRTSPKAGEQRAYVATTEQVWALYEAFPERQRVAVLLGGMVGLRTAEAVGLRVSDVDFLRGVVTPAVQAGGLPLKTESSRWPVPIPRELVEDFLAPHVERWPGQTLLTNDRGEPLPTWTLDRLVRRARGRVDGLPEEFRFHDLRHYFASLLISQGLDVKVVQRRVRHASAKTTLDTYAHLWPDSDDTTRAAVASALSARADWLRTGDDGPGRLRRSEA
ncbi:tyrosine-type recombinase/integrase [Kineococcus sp. TBRC 1896]|uniref:Tyrosine-type recombinase/integrase n=1 Tax=Kineococcus mangrovi TaxID=1660183 RepID=A0ABV4HZ99_9ACTN